MLLLSTKYTLNGLVVVSGKVGIGLGVLVVVEAVPDPVDIVEIRVEIVYSSN